MDIWIMWDRRLVTEEMLLSTAIRWFITADTFSGKALILRPPEMRSVAWEVCIRYFCDGDVLARCTASAFAATLDLAAAFMEERRRDGMSGECSASH